MFLPLLPGIHPSKHLPHLFPNSTGASIHDPNHLTSKPQLITFLVKAFPMPENVDFA